MSLTLNFQLMSIYNQSINKKIYATVKKIDDEIIREDRGAYLGSILGTLNHILVGDWLEECAERNRIWLTRFATHPKQYATLDYVRNLDSPTDS